MGVETRVHSQERAAVSSCGFLGLRWFVLLETRRVCYRLTAQAALGRHMPESHPWPPVACLSGCVLGAGATGLGPGWLVGELGL